MHIDISYVIHLITINTKGAKKKKLFKKVGATCTGHIARLSTTLITYTFYITTLLIKSKLKQRTP